MTDVNVVLDSEIVLVDAPAELTMCAHTMRVAIQGAMTDDAPFVVQPLKTGQPLPEGAIEAMLVLTGEVAGSRTNGSDQSWEYRAFETRLGRYRTVINDHGKRALRLLVSAVKPG